MTTQKWNIKLGLSLLNPVKLLALLINVIAKMTGNTAFGTPAVPLATLQAKADELSTAIEDATDGSRQSKIVRDDLVAVVKDLLRVQADYVRTVCAGDEAKLQSSGFELAKQREPIGVPGVAKNLEVRSTNAKGTLDLRWPKVRGAYGYRVWRTTNDPSVEANWESIAYTTRAGYLATGLESHKGFWFTVSAIGAAGEGLQCDPAMGRAA